MTEERKQELAELLEEAMEEVVIKSRSGDKLISIDKYREDVQACRQAYRPDLSYLFHYHPEIKDDVVKSKLFDFIKEELAAYIRDDMPGYPARIKPASWGIGEVGFSMGYSLDRFLEKILELVIVRGAEVAISNFDKCTRETEGSFKKIILLRGIELGLENPEIELEQGRELQVYDGIHLVALPAVPTGYPNLPPYLFDDGWMTRLFGSHPMDFSRKTLIVIDCVVEPLFFRPEPFADIQKEISNPFQFEIQSAEFPDFDEDKFCQALSLSCNSAIQPVLEWDHIDEDEIFSMRGEGVVGGSNRIPPFDYRGAAHVSDTQIEEAKCLYKKLVALDPDVHKKLRIPIDRWIQSKADRDTVDQMIDLGIAFEALYLLDIDETTELSFRLRLRAAWYLGENEEDRRRLMKEFREIYDWRSKVVHTGKVPNKKKKTPFTPKEVEKFIKRAQELCQESIMKILNAEQFPDRDYWNSLVLGGEDEQASS